MKMYTKSTFALFLIILTVSFATPLLVSLPQIPQAKAGYWEYGGYIEYLEGWYNDGFMWEGEFMWNSWETDFYDYGYPSSRGLYAGHDGYDTGTFAHAAMVWEDVDIPAGAEITSAYVRFCSKSYQTERCNTRIRTNDSNFPNEYGTGFLWSNPFDTSQGSTQTNWIIEDTWDYREYVYTPDISQQVQETIDCTWWSNGEELVVYWLRKWVSPNTFRNVYDYREADLDNNNAFTPRLNVQWRYWVDEEVCEIHNGAHDSIIERYYSPYELHLQHLDGYLIGNWVTRYVNFWGENMRSYITPDFNDGNSYKPDHCYVPYSDVATVHNLVVTITDNTMEGGGGYVWVYINGDHDGQLGVYIPSGFVGTTYNTHNHRYVQEEVGTVGARISNEASTGEFVIGHVSYDLTYDND